MVKVKIISSLIKEIEKTKEIECVNTFAELAVLLFLNDEINVAEVDLESKKMICYLHGKVVLFETLKEG